MKQFLDEEVRPMRRPIRHPLTREKKCIEGGGVRHMGTDRPRHC